MKPFVVGDRAALLWGDNTGPVGTVTEILNLNKFTPYAKVLLDNGKEMLYPTYRLKPVGWTWWTLRHLSCTISEIVLGPKY